MAKQKPYEIFIAEANRLYANGPIIGPSKVREIAKSLSVQVPWKHIERFKEDITVNLWDFKSVVISALPIRFEDDPIEETLTTSLEEEMPESLQNRFRQSMKWSGRSSAPRWSNSRLASCGTCTRRVKLPSGAVLQRLGSPITRSISVNRKKMRRNCSLP